MMQLPLNLEINASQISSEVSKPKLSQQPCNAGVVPPPPLLTRQQRLSVGDNCSVTHSLAGRSKVSVTLSSNCLGLHAHSPSSLSVTNAPFFFFRRKRDLEMLAIWSRLPSYFSP